MNATDIVMLNGEDLTVESVVRIARGNTQVAIAESARERMVASRDLKLNLVELNKPIYGVSTGFGDSADRQISSDKAARLQKNLVQYHINGTGPKAPSEVVLATMVVRANCLARGASAINPAVVDRLVAMINERVIPVIPERGSVGASGDLVPLCYLANAIIGAGEVRWRGRTMDMEMVRAELGWEPIRLEAKDG